MAAHVEAAEGARPGLKKGLGTFELTGTGIGIIVGAGIFVLIGEAAGMAGGALWVPFLLAAMAAVFTGLSYAELSAMFPKAAASFEFTRQAFGLRLAFMVGWLMLFANIVSAAAVALGFSSYLSSFINVALVPGAIALIFLAGLVLFLGVKESVGLGVLFTSVEVAGLVIAIVVSLKFVGKADYLETPEGLGGLFRATTLVFFAYLGFEQIASLSEEARDARRSVPVAILMAVAVTTGLYVAVAITSVSALGWEKLSQSEAPLADVVEAATGAHLSRIVAVIALVATASTVLLLQITSSRLLYGMSTSGTLPRMLSAIHSRRKTPWVAALVATVIAAAFALLGDIAAVAQLSNFAVLAAFVMVNASLVWLRYTRPGLERPFRVPWNLGKMPVIALLGVAFSLFMLAQIGWLVMTYGVGVAALGLAALVLLRRFGKPQLGAPEREATARSQEI
jgi:APA family basic amino acid/polyamine antiporter